MKLKRLRLKGRAYYYDHGGKPRKWEALGSVRSEALRKYADIERGKESGLHTFGDLVRLFLAKKQQLEANTLRSYRLYSRILEKAGAYAASLEGEGSLDQGHMNQMIDDYKSKHTARNTALFVKTVYAWGVSRGYVKTSPFTGMRLKGTSRRKRYLTDSEFLAARTHLAPKFQVAADMAYLLGLRVSEVRTLKFSDFKDGVVSIWQKKTKKFKYQTITPDVMNALERAKTLPGTIRGVHLVCNRRGQPYSEGTLSDAFKTALRAAGITDARFHDIRAKSASDEPESAKGRLDHANQQTTNSYIRKPVIATPIKGIK
jgi:integrase